MSYQAEIEKYIALEIETLKKLDIGALDAAIQLIERTWRSEKNIYIFGNGGSGATASHFQNDFNKGISEYTEPKFNFICLNDNMATITAIANDTGYEEIFHFQLKGRLKDGDIVIAISGSGNSPNVINAVEFAKESGNKIIGLSGYDGGKLAKLSDISLHAPVMSMQVTEDVHMMFDHLIMSIFYKSLCGIEHLK